MPVPFSEMPGRHERHYRRKINNPLFPQPVMDVDQDELLNMQRLDHEELIAFLTELRETVQQAVELKPNEGSEVILELKEKLDRLYEASAGLADEQQGNQQAIRQLVAVIMKSVWAAAAGDSKALDELEQEDRARTLHFDLLQQALVADLLHPQSLISAAELAPTLLSEDEAAVAAALQIFDSAQLNELLHQAGKLLQHVSDAPEPVMDRLTQIRNAI